MNSLIELYRANMQTVYDYPWYVIPVSSFGVGALWMWFIIHLAESRKKASAPATLSDREEGTDEP